MATFNPILTFFKVKVHKKKNFIQTSHLGLLEILPASPLSFTNPKNNKQQKSFELLPKPFIFFPAIEHTLVSADKIRLTNLHSQSAVVLGLGGLDTAVLFVRD